MKWFTAQQLFIAVYYWYTSQKPSSPPSPSSSIITFDRILSEWVLQLAQRPLLHYSNWMLKCPKYMNGCCLLVKTVDDEPDILTRLTDLSPVHAVSYLFMRRLAEVTAQLVISWLLIVWAIALVISICCWLASKKHVDKNRKNSLEKPSAVWNLKHVWLLLLLLPMSFLPCYVYDSAFSQIHPQHVASVRQGVFATLLNLMPWKKRLNIEDPPTVLNLLPPRLHQELYGKDEFSRIYETQKLCRVAKISLSWWSALIFTLLVCGVIAMALYVFIWLPLERAFLRFYSDDSRHHSKCEKTYTKNLHPTESDEMIKSSGFPLHGIGDGAFKRTAVMLNLKPEAGDRLEFRKHNLKYHSPEGAVEPLYINRGVMCCLDDKKKILK